MLLAHSLTPRTRLRRRRTAIAVIAAAIVALLGTLIPAIAFAAPATIAPQADAPMRMRVGSDSPLLLTQLNIGNDLGHTDGFKRNYNSGWSMAQLWASVPDDLKHNIGFVLHQGHTALSDNNTALSTKWLEDNVAEADALGIPVFILWGEGVTQKSNKFAFTESLYQKYPHFMGTVVSELTSTLGDLDQALQIANNYGGFHVLGSLDEANLLGSRLENQTSWNNVAKYSKNFIFNPKNFHENFETSNAWTQGAWLAGAFDNWGPYFDGYPYYSCGYFGLNATAYANCGDRWSRSIGETVSSTMMLDQWQNGATVFHLENQLDVPTTGSLYSPYFYQSILPAMRYILSHHTPTKADVIAQTKVVYSEAAGNICALKDSTPGRSTNPCRPTFFSMYEKSPALTAIQKQLWFYLRSDGRYNIIPRIPKLAPASLLAQFDTVLTADTYNASLLYGDKRDALLNSKYPEISTGEAFVQKSGSTWLMYNTNDRDNFNEDATLKLGGSTFSRLEMPEVTPHTWAMVEDKGSSLTVMLDNYRTDREADLLKPSGVRDMEYNRNFVKYAYVPNPQDAELRTTTMRFDVPTKPTLTISGYDRNGYTYNEEWNPNTHQYTLTVRSNGVVDIRLSTAGHEDGWNSVTASSPQIASVTGGKEFTFDGTSVAWTVPAGSAGTAKASIDGTTFNGAVDLATGGTVFRATGLSNSVHTLKLEGSSIPITALSYVPSVEHDATSLETNDFNYGTEASDEDILYGSDGWRVTQDGKLKLVGFVFPFYGDTTVYNTNKKLQNVKYEASVRLIKGTSGSLMVRGNEDTKQGFFFRLDPSRTAEGRTGSAGYSCSLHSGNATGLNSWAAVATCPSTLTLNPDQDYNVVVTANGNTITASIDGTQVLSYTSATPSSGYTGVRAAQAQSDSGNRLGQFVQLDDVKLTDLDSNTVVYQSNFDNWSKAEGWMTETPLVFDWNEKADPRSSFTFPWKWTTNGGSWNVVDTDAYTSGLSGYYTAAATGSSDLTAFGGAESGWATDGGYDYWSWLNIKDGDQAGLAVRVKDASNMYQVRLNVASQTVSFGRLVNGTWTSLAASPSPVPLAKDAWQLAKVTSHGSLFTIIIGGKTALTVRDGTFSTGSAGVWAKSGTTVDVDDARVVARPAKTTTAARGTSVDVPLDGVAGTHITGFNQLAIKTARTTQPVLPSTVTARYSDGTTGAANVTWPTIDASQLAVATPPTKTGPSVGKFTIEGTVAGTNLKIPVLVTVMPNLTTTYNITGTYSSASPSVPDQVPATLGVFNDGSRTYTKQLYVRWEQTPNTSFDAPATQVITGSINGYPWAQVSATMTVTRDAKPVDPEAPVEEVKVNAALNKPVTSYYTFGGSNATNNANRQPAKMVDGSTAADQGYFTGGNSEGALLNYSATAPNYGGDLCSWAYVDLGADYELSNYKIMFGQNSTVNNNRMWDSPYEIQILSAADAAASTTALRNSSVCPARTFVSGKGTGNYSTAAYVVTPANDIWKTVSSGTGTLTLDDHPLTDPVTARYVRVLLNEPATGMVYGTAVYELELWGLQLLSNTVKPVITGDAALGKTLTADAGTWSVDAPTLRYHWLRDGQPITGATAATYAVTAADLGKAVAVTVTAAKDGYKSSSATSETITVANAPQNVALGKPVVAYAQLANTARAPGKMVDGDSATAWYSGGATDGAFSDGTSSSQQGSLCTWAYVDLGADHALSSFAVGFMENLTTNGNMFDPPYEIQVLSSAEAAKHTTAERNGATCTRTSGGNGYATVEAVDDIWSTIASGVGTFEKKSYDLAPGVTARYVRILSNEPQTAHRFGMAVSELELYGVASTTTAFSNTAPPVVSGSTTVGQTLSATAGEWGSETPSIAYQWYRDGAPISGATAATYTLAAADRDTKLVVRTTANLSGVIAYANSAAVSVTGEVAIANTQAPTIAGDAIVGSALSASGGEWSVTEPALAYQWLRDGTEIADATSSQYVVQTADVGRQLAVRVTATKPGYAQAAVTSAAVEAALPSITSVNVPAISGTPVVGETLTVSAGTWSVTDPQVTYQWLRNGSPIDAATSSSYRLIEADAGTDVSAAVVASASGYVDGTASASPVHITTATQPLIVNTAPPVIAGAAKVGQTLSATPGIWSVEGVTVGYEWLLDGMETGATGATYPLSEQTLGRSVSVRATAAKPGHVDGIATSGSVVVQSADQPAVVPPIDESLLTDENRGSVSTISEAPAGADLLVQLGADAAGKTFTVYLHSTPAYLGALQAAADNTVGVSIPVATTPGVHRIVVLNADGSLYGWTSLTIRSAVSDPGQSSGDTDPASASPDELSSTGSNIASGVLLGALLLLLGVAAISRRRRVAE